MIFLLTQTIEHKLCTSVYIVCACEFLITSQEIAVSYYIATTCTCDHLIIEHTHTILTSLKN